VVVRVLLYGTKEKNEKKKKANRWVTPYIIFATVFHGGGDETRTQNSPAGYSKPWGSVGEGVIWGGYPQDSKEKQKKTIKRQPFCRGN